MSQATKAPMGIGDEITAYLTTTSISLVRTAAHYRVCVIDLVTGMTDQGWTRTLPGTSEETEREARALAYAAAVLFRKPGEAVTTVHRPAHYLLAA